MKSIILAPIFKKQASDNHEVKSNPQNMIEVNCTSDSIPFDRKSIKTRLEQESKKVLKLDQNINNKLKLINELENQLKTKEVENTNLHLKMTDMCLNQINFSN
mmetsp:Transcript_25761/g.22857  ORF Transcript_25761/g.22857 Transcript_25761/m.22857 type:complete len:103 (+) Transcript_25761:684-992(+)